MPEVPVPPPDLAPPTRPPLMALLDAAARVLHDHFGEHMDAAGHHHTLTASKVMGSITSEGVRLSDLAERLGVTKQSAGQVVDDLVAQGYLTRLPDPTDGRAKLIVFGPRGHDALPAAWAALRASDALAEDVLGEERVEVVRTALEELAEAGRRLAER